MIERSEVLAFLDGLVEHYETLYHSAVNDEVQADERKLEAAQTLVERERTRWKVAQIIRHEFTKRFPEGKEGGNG